MRQVVNYGSIFNKITNRVLFRILIKGFPETEWLLQEADCSQEQLQEELHLYSQNSQITNTGQFTKRNINIILLCK